MRGKQPALWTWDAPLGFVGSLAATHSFWLKKPKQNQHYLKQCLHSDAVSYPSCAAFQSTLFCFQCITCKTGLQFHTNLFRPQHYFNRTWCIGMAVILLSMVFSLSLECFWFAQGQLIQEPYLHVIPCASLSYLGPSINDILS